MQLAARCLAILFAAMLAVSSPAGEPAESLATFTNPMDVPLADPAVLFHDGTYYLAGTTYDRFVSRDLIHWDRAGRYLDPRETPIRDWPWAAELYEQDGRFFFLFCSPLEGTGGRRLIGIAASDDPMGAFTPIALPLWDDGKSWIDPHVFRDDDGTAYLYVTRDDIGTEGNSQVWVAPLAPTLERLAGDLKLCLRTSQQWENGVQEGVTVFKHGGAYYMTYSSQGFGSPAYAVGYATATHPAGPWAKAAENPILSRRAGTSGTGHNGIAPSPDGSELFAVYHRHMRLGGGGQREVAIDRMRFVPNPGAPDRLVIDGPTVDPQPIPSGAAPARIFLGRDEFEGDAPDRTRWSTLWLGEPDALRVEGGALCIRALPGDIHQLRNDARNILLAHAPPTGDWTVTAKVALDNSTGPEQAVLLIWQDANHYIALKKTNLGRPVFEAALEADSYYTPAFLNDDTGPVTFLRIAKSGERYACLVSATGQDWQTVGLWSARMAGPKVGLGSWSMGTPNDPRIVRFDFIEVRRNTP